MDIKDMLLNHKLWVEDNSKGKRAYLSGADLSGATLSGAYLSGAILSGAKGILVFGPGGSRGDMTYAIKHMSGWMVKVGCFWGTVEELFTVSQNKYRDSEYGKFYLSVCNFLKTV